MPLAGWYAVVSADLKMERLPPKYICDVSRLAALGAWRITQGIYSFHPETLDQLGKTSVSGDLPSDVFYRLPEWCLYIDVPGYLWGGLPIHGFFVHLEHDANDGRTELRFLMDTERVGLAPFMLHLGNWSLKESIDKAAAIDSENSHNPQLQAAFSSIESISAIEPFLMQVLYLCSKEPEYRGTAKPSKPHPKRTKKGWRLFPADKPRFWSIGFEIGELIAQSKREHGIDKSRPKPHIRRAHWHGYWLGPRSEEQRFEFRWLPPIPVNVERLDEIK